MEIDALREASASRDAEIAVLRAEVARLQTEHEEDQGVIAVWRRRTQDAETEVARLREALKFYAVRWAANWTGDGEVPGGTLSFNEPPYEIERDAGQIARAALRGEA